MAGRAHARDDDPAAAVGRAIRQIQHEQRVLAARIGTAVATQAQTAQALRQQHVVLSRVRAEIVQAKSVAERAAESARADEGPAAAVPFDQTAAGLQAQLDAVQLALDEITGMQHAAHGNTERARALLRNSRASLDEALREQMRLLARLERLHRQRLIAEARQQARRHGDPTADPDR
jgi:hypothetical protein